MSGYTHDVFVSYAHKGGVPEWVQNHLVPVLRETLQDELADEPALFFDRDIGIGERWPDALERALMQSRLLLCIWSPAYFRSGWCLAEWRTMLARQEFVTSQSGGEVPPLIYPIVYSDGLHFPEDAQATQQAQLFKGYAYPYPQFRESREYLAFHDLVRTLAQQLAGRLREVPDWTSDWRVVRPTSTTPAAPVFRRL